MSEAAGLDSPTRTPDRLMRRIVVAFFAAWLVAGFVIHDDYGVSWDEENNRDVGRRTYQYVAARIAGEPVTWAAISRGLVADHGPFFETILYAVERGAGLEDSRSILLMRHLATFLAFWAGTIAFYAALRLRFDNRLMALAGTALLVLSPRHFAHSFYNSKDIVMVALFMAGILSLVRFVRIRSYPSALVHAFVCAAAVGIRVVGLLLPAVTLVALALALAGQKPGERQWKKNAATTAVYLLSFVVFTVLFWPSLWDDPAGYVTHALSRMTTVKQWSNPTSLYMGEFVSVQQLPWHYLPVWMLITIPLPACLLFACGLWASARSLLSASWLEWENVQTIVFLLLFFVPVVAVIVLRPVLYDDWRHLYFVFPAFVAIAVTGLNEIWTSRALGKVAPVLTGVAVIHAAWVLVSYHPYQNVYFNALAGRDVESRFELDYWGLSFREGLEFVLNADPASVVRVSGSDYPVRLNARILEPEKRARLKFGKVADANWFLTNHRQPKHFANFRARRFPCENEAHAVRRGGATMLGVFKLR